MARSATHLYNDDLLVSEESRALAQQRFTKIFYILDNPELRAIFKPVADEANLAKERSHNAGVVAVLLALFSLCATVAEPIWHGLPAYARDLITIVSAASAIGAVYLALFGVMRGKRKRSWLENRLFTERLRQAHFQMLIWRLSEIPQSEDLVPQFLSNRRKWLAGYAAQLRGSLDGLLSAILDPSRQAEAWVFQANPNDRPIIPPGYHLAPIFEAYGVLRIEAQIAYADHKLRESGWSIDPRRITLRTQQKQFRYLWSTALSAMVLLHFAILLDVFVERTLPESAWNHVIVGWLAVLALGIKTLQEGLGVNSEIARYKEYRSEVNYIGTRFYAATNAERRLEIMMEMERAAFQEMRDFLRVHDESTFLL